LWIIGQISLLIGVFYFSALIQGKLLSDHKILHQQTRNITVLYGMKSISILFKHKVMSFRHGSWVWL